MSSGYRNPPNGRLRRKAVPRLQGRSHEGKGAARAAIARAEDRKTYRSGGGSGNGRQVTRRPQLALDVEALDVGDAARASSSCSSIWSIAGYLSVSSGVSDANKRLPANAIPVLQEAELAAHHLGHEHPHARHRPLDERPGRPELRPALGLDDAAAHRSGPPSPRLSLDPARPARVDPRLRRAEGQRRDADRRPEARDPDRRRPLRAGPAGQSRRRHRHGVVRAVDRRGRRHRHQRAGERSSRTASTARTPGRAARAGRAGASPRACST